MKITILLLALFTVILFSCSKDDDESTANNTDVNCDNAEICMKNLTGDTVFYCWGCNFYEDTLLPGTTVCRDIGPVQITATTESYSINYFDSDHGSYVIRPTSCSTETEVN